jgi:hypothetical protein
MWGILKRLRSIGDNKMIASTIKNISTGFVTNGVVAQIVIFNGID